MVNEDSPEAAQAFAATGSLVLSYPTALAQPLAPHCGRDDGGWGRFGAAADALLARLPDEPLLAIARAIRLEQKGQTDRCADGLRRALRWSRPSGRGAVRPYAPSSCVLPRVRRRRPMRPRRWNAASKPGGAMRASVICGLRTAAIQAQAGRWRAGFDTLKETAQLFPSDRSLIAARVTALMGEMLHGPAAASIPPLDLVALAGENADAVAQTDAAGLASVLADRLMALDLPQRAAPVVERMVRAAPPGLGQAGLGARLAAMRLAEGDAGGAATALATTDTPGLSPALQEERSLLDARIHAQRHDIAGRPRSCPGSTPKRPTNCVRRFWGRAVTGMAPRSP